MLLRMEKWFLNGSCRGDFIVVFLLFPIDSPPFREGLGEGLLFLGVHSLAGGDGHEVVDILY